MFRLDTHQLGVIQYIARLVVFLAVAMNNQEFQAECIRYTFLLHVYLFIQAH